MKGNKRRVLIFPLRGVSRGTGNLVTPKCLLKEVFKTEGKRRWWLQGGGGEGGGNKGPKKGEQEFELFTANVVSKQKKRGKCRKKASPVESTKEKEEKTGCEGLKCMGGKTMSDSRPWRPTRR